MPLTKSKNAVCLRANNLWFFYGTEPIIQDVSLTINQGEFAGIAGPNGAGKSTLMKLLIGLLQPQKGNVTFTCQKDDCEDSLPCRPCIGYVPQQATLKEQQFPVTVREVVQMGRFNHAGLLRPLGKLDEKEVDTAIREAGLKGVENDLFGDLSGGQQQRVLVARALVSNPHLLALDEPVSGVDSKAKADFYDLLGHLHEKHNMAVLIILHDLPDLTEHVDRLIFLQRKIIYDGQAKNLGPTGLWELMVKASKT